MSIAESSSIGSDFFAEALDQPTFLVRLVHTVAGRGLGSSPHVLIILSVPIRKKFSVNLSFLAFLNLVSLSSN